MTSNIIQFVLAICLHPAVTHPSLEEEGFWANIFRCPIVREQIHDVYVHETTAVIMHEFDISVLQKRDEMYKERNIDNATCEESDALQQFCKEYEHGINDLSEKFTSVWKDVKKNIGSFNRDQQKSKFASSKFAKDMIHLLEDDEMEWRLYFRDAENMPDNPVIVQSFQTVSDMSTSDLLQSSVDLLRKMDYTSDTEFPTQLAKTLIAEKEQRLAELARRLTSSVADCKMEDIPFQNWNDWMPLKTSLKSLEKNMASDGLRLTIPVERPEDYTQVPMATCFFTKSTMRVMVYVPVRRKDVNWTLYKVLSAPFYDDKNRDELADLEIYENAVGEANGKYVIFTEEMRNGCDRRPRGLCRIEKSVYDSARYMEPAKGTVHVTKQEL